VTTSSESINLVISPDKQILSISHKELSYRLLQSLVIFNLFYMTGKITMYEIGIMNVLYKKGRNSAYSL